MQKKLIGRLFIIIVLLSMGLASKLMAQLGEGESVTQVGAQPISEPLAEDPAVLAPLNESITVASPLVEAAQEQELFDNRKNKYKRRFIQLSTSVTHDEPLPIELPKSTIFRGDYKAAVSATYLKSIKSIRFIGVKEGVGTLTIMDNKGRILIEYRVDVRKNKLDHVLREIQTFLVDIEGIQIRIINNKVILDGHVLVPKDIGRIYTVLSQYGDQAASLVTLAPNAQKKLAEIIARDINNPEIEVRSINDKIVLQGFAASEDEKARAEIIAKLYLPGTVMDKAEQDQVLRKPKAANDGVINLISVKPQAAPPPSKLIQIVIHFVELQKDYGKRFLFQFMPNLKDGTQITFSSGQGSTGSSTTISGIIDNFIPKLNWGKEHGYARVIESATVLVQDTKSGLIHSGLKIPYTVQTPQGPTTQLQDVGFKSQITPVIFGERSDLINLTISAELSTPADNERGSVSTNNVNTDISVRSGQSAAFGGLIRNLARTDYNKSPVNSTGTPIISLNANRSFSRQQGQFVFFVTPVIKASASQGVEKIKRKFRLSE